MKSPKVLAFANQKGGAGKSTGSAHAADWFSQKGASVVLVDADGQQSSSAWLQELGLPYKIISDPETLFESLPKLAKEYDVVVVDGPGSLSEVTKAILARCDLVLVPSRESIIDLRSTGKILQFIRHAKELRKGSPKAAIFLNAVSKGSVLLREAQDALGDSLVPLLETVVYDRQCIKDAPGQGSTVFHMRGKPAKDAAANYESLFNEALKFFNDK
ncbi:MAG: ParA family protein [Drouetiella hepatica Uher 2000/2452]|jgi:chromosome partitioning protein|uniref:ParA family protein n=1 Tax=Drouetiella hepatica Uher 2000/2452 TaxID=904376 RepID=A0A951USC5_9CYAN|nr:ParA family protein [Drouetiella hepatica Uher 2000/2452]